MTSADFPVGLFSTCADFLVGFFLFVSVAASGESVSASPSL